ncbi:30S ribosomal protein S17 [Candidatus Woesearchaeota archaeon]|nr:30S ribosomal protein S17 [Candidatus Woesearchaeota archaeon]
MKKSKNIGIKVDLPKEKCDDQFCPFHGKLKLRGQAFTGTVMSSKMQKSAVVQWVTRHHLPKYERYIKKKSQISVHNPPCMGAKEGDEVKIMQCRPLSKTKNFVIVQVLGKSKEFVSKEKLYEVEERKEMERKRNREEAEKE